MERSETVRDKSDKRGQTSAGNAIAATSRQGSVLTAKIRPVIEWAAWTLANG